VGAGFHEELTGRENIYLNGSIMGMKKREVTAKLEEIVEFSGLARFLDTPIKRYSSGMLMRLAFSVAAHLDPDILLLDIGLPGMDGYELARRLRADPAPELRGARMIALTGYGRETDIDLARSAGFEAHLTKPFDVAKPEALMTAPNPR
jgi:CheY-like chemotaxis protein